MHTYLLNYISINVHPIQFLVIHCSQLNVDIQCKTKVSSLGEKIENQTKVYDDQVYDDG